MSSDDWHQICDPETAATVNAAQFYSKDVSTPQSPIDDYYEYVEHVLTLGSPSALTASPTLGRLLLLGLVTGVERYIRSVLSAVVQQCPISRRCCSDQQIPFGAIDFYDNASIGLALFDATSLAGGDEIRKKTKSVLGIEIPKNSSAHAALDEFDKLCHLRHAAVHSRGSLGRRNMTALGAGIDAAGGFSVLVSFADLQDAGVACHSFVRSFNRLIFRLTVERWRGESLLTGQWASDRDAYSGIYAIFRSRRDLFGPSNAYHSYRAVLKAMF